MENYCVIDSKNNTNKCYDPELQQVYDNKDTGVDKVNNFNSINAPSSAQNNSTIGLTQRLNDKSTMPSNNSTLPFAHIGHKPNDNTIYAADLSKK